MQLLAMTYNINDPSIALRLPIKFISAASQEIALDVNTKIPLPANTIAVRTSGLSKGIRVSFKGGFLYDPIEATDEFEDAVTLDITTKADIGDLPPQLAEYITAMATVEFLRIVERDQLADAFAKDKLRKARLAALREDSDMRGSNMLNNIREESVRGWRLNRNNVVR